MQVLAEAKRNEDISVEDLGEMFYISYEMAAHRLTNLITRHFGIPVHFQRSDHEGRLWKAYENDGVLLPADVDGTIEGQRLCRWWSSRQAFESEDSYELHYQRTETVTGTLLVRDPHRHRPRSRRRDHLWHVDSMSHWFRGSDTTVARFRRAPTPPAAGEPHRDAVTAGRARPGPRRVITASSSPVFPPTRSYSTRTPASTSSTSTSSSTATARPWLARRTEP